MKYPSLNVLGLMSGTSLDGLDLCLCQISGLKPDQIKQVGFSTLPMPAELQAKIRKNLEPDTSAVDSLCELNMQVADWFAQSIERFLKLHYLSFADLDLIGSHGQTLYHLPPGQSQQASTLQIGDGGWLAQRTGITTVTNFRPADMAVGGQGAPLVPYLDSVWFQSESKQRAVQNIGGMANVSWLPIDGKMLAFDNGPGNALIDGFAQAFLHSSYDRGGRVAQSGQINQNLLQDWLSHPYFDQPPPRTTGREIFGQAWLDREIPKAQSLDVADAMATITAFSARSIAESYQRWLPTLPDEVIVSGGGVHNQALMQGLADALPGSRITNSGDFNLDPDAKEAILFALLAYTSLLGIPNNLPKMTGAIQSVVMGQIAPAKNWLQLLNQCAPYLKEIQS